MSGDPENPLTFCRATGTGDLPDPSCRLFVEHIIHGIVTEFERKTGADIASIMTNMQATRMIVEGAMARMTLVSDKVDKLHAEIYTDNGLRDKVRDHEKLISELRYTGRALWSLFAALLVALATVWFQWKWGTK